VYGNAATVSAGCGADVPIGAGVVARACVAAAAIGKDDADEADPAAAGPEGDTREPARPTRMKLAVSENAKCCRNVRPPSKGG
jgi:hypothetical protein